MRNHKQGIYLGSFAWLTYIEVPKNNSSISEADTHNVTWQQYWQIY